MQLRFRVSCARSRSSPPSRILASRLARADAGATSEPLPIDASDEPLARFARAVNALLDSSSRRVELATRPLLDELEALRRAAAASSREQAALRYVLDKLPHGVFWKDTRRALPRLQRQAAARFLGMSREELVGRTDEELPIPREVAQRCRESDRELTDGGALHVERDERLQLGGATRALWSSKVPLRDESGRVVGILGHYVDVTEHAQREERLDRARRDAEADSRARSALLASVSHDLRTPLTLISRRSRRSSTGRRAS